MEQRRFASIDQIKDMLQARALGVAQICLPNGQMDGRHWRCGSIHGEKGQSLAVCINVAGKPAGMWRDFAGGEGGDIIDLIKMTVAGGDIKQALKWAREFLGLDTANPDAWKRDAEKAKARLKVKAQEGAEERKRTGKFAHRLWLEAEADLVGTPVEKYLGQRGLVLNRLPSTGAMRYAARHKHGQSKQTLPAMLTAMFGVDGNFMALHRTFLARDKAGNWGKAPLGKLAKTTLGLMMGSHISLGKGKDGKSIGKGADDTLIITEGIEDGLTLAMASPDHRVVAAGIWACSPM